VPTPHYPANLDRFNAVIDSFNADVASEFDARLAAAQVLWTAAAIGLNDRTFTKGVDIDVVSYLARAKSGEFWPSHIAKSADNKTRKEEILANWPQFLGQHAGGSDHSKHFVAKLALDLIGDPVLTMFPGVRDRSRALIEYAERCTTMLNCFGMYDGHNIDVILSDGVNTGHGNCLQRMNYTASTLKNVLIKWRTTQGLSAANSPPVATKADYADWGSEAQQLKLIELLRKALFEVLVRKFVWWPGGPAPSPVVDWGLVALLYIGGLALSVATAASGGAAGAGLAAFASAAAGAGAGMAGLASKAMAEIEEGKRGGEKTSGGKVASAVMSTGFQAYKAGAK
jgi:hypothetical protein